MLIVLLSAVAHVHAADGQLRLCSQVKNAIIYRYPVERIQHLIKDITDVNLQFNSLHQITLCHIGASYNMVGVIDALYNKGGDISIKDADGETSLHHAAHRNSLEAAKVLLKYGADTQEKNNLGQTPADIARTNGYEEIVQLLDDFESIPDGKEPEKD